VDARLRSSAKISTLLHGPGEICRWLSQVVGPLRFHLSQCSRTSLFLVDQRGMNYELTPSNPGDKSQTSPPLRVGPNLGSIQIIGIAVSPTPSGEPCRLQTFKTAQSVYLGGIN